MTPRPEPDRESPEPARGPTHADLRADYDDEFGRVRTPRDVARRRLLLPGLDFVVFGAVGLSAAIVTAVFILIDYIGDAADPLTYLEMVGLLALVGLGGAVALVILLGGGALLNLRNHRLALVAAYIVTCTSLASLYAILFYPFGIWALVLLHKTEVRREFDQVPASPAADRHPTPAWVFMLLGGFACAILLLVLALVAWDAMTGNDHWEDWELALAYGLLGGGILASAGVFAYGTLRGRRRATKAGPEQPHVERPEPGPAAGPPAADV
jgi:hypothetical protein